MFALRSWIVSTLRAILIVTILSNALVPIPVAALAPVPESKTDVSSIPHVTVGMTNKHLIFHSSSRHAYRQQDATPVVTETPTPESTPIIDTLFPDITDTPVPTLETTPTPTDTPIAIQTTASQSALPAISVTFSAEQTQAKIGDKVVFTLRISNTGELAITGLRFSNILPPEFQFISNNDKNVDFSPQTHEIIWISDASTILMPGESIILEYTVVITEASIESAQIVDSATLSADGLVEPLTAETTLFISNAGKSLTFLDSKGGTATGMEGRVSIKVPENGLNAPGAISVEEVTGWEGAPSLVFELGLESPKQVDAQSMTPQADSADLNVFPTLSPTETPIPSEEELATQTDDTSDSISEITATATTIPIDVTNNSAAEKSSGSSEHDRITSFDTIEAKFNKPVILTVSFDNIADLATLTADQAPYLVTLDESSNTWVQVPLQSIDPNSNTITAEVDHFSVWGVGIGSLTPQNGANILLYHKPYSDLFTGGVSYSFPIWTPPGRNGLAPNLALSYSSKTADGLLGDVQAPWAGMGWNIDTVEIARKITNGACSPCGSGSYGYENKFILLFNGIGYELIPDGVIAGRYHTKNESFLYIQLHNPNLGNNSPAKTTGAREWWEVVERDGTRWRLGWTAASEQLAAMKGYPGAATGSWAALGYAGSLTNAVGRRWRADQVTDVFGNRVTFTYFEETRTVQGTTRNYDRANYLDTITYTSHTSGTPTPGYSVVFVRENRAGSDAPVTQLDWDNWDTYRLDRIDVKYGSTIVRSYDLSYTTNSYTDDTKSWQTTVLTSVAVNGGGLSAPTTIFTYSDKDNRANCGTGCQEWAYPRLATVSNGWGSTTTYTYGNDGRPNTSWYNWRVETIDIADGVNANPMKTIFAYTTPCYNDPTAGWCNGGSVGELIGYGQTTVTTKDFDGTTTLGISVSSFYTDEQKAGRQYILQNQDASGTSLSQTNTSYTVVTAGLPTNGYFTYANAVEESLQSTGMVRVHRTEYDYSATTGNLTFIKDYDGTPTLYRETDYEYVTNTSASVWILNTLSRQTLKDAGGVVLSKKEYGYNGNLPGVGSPTANKPDLTRVVDGTQTIDAKFVYDTYGNVTETRLYKNYGTTGSQPAGTYLSYTNVYETALRTYATSKTTPIIPSTTIGYDFGLGMPTTVTDPNGNTTTTIYDGLGRVTSITYPGFGSPNIQYTYPDPPLTAPFAIKVDMWDQPANLYRSSWQVLDGLGRTIQTQSPYETVGDLVLTDTSYNAQGLTLYQGLPRNYTGAGGNYFLPVWGSVPHSASAYDALGRRTSVTYADSSLESFAYSGLRTTMIDRNSHQTAQEVDAFGRQVKTEEYTGSSNPYTLYGTTTYEYDPRDLLKKVTDAANNQMSIGYNGFGRKTSMSDPDMGSWGYGYSVLGNLTSQTDARGCVTTVTYDDLNRPTGKTYTGPGACDSTPDVTYTYDSTTGGNEGWGRRTGMTDGSGSTTYFYNVLGQLTNETHNIESTNYGISATFDAFNRPLTQTLPSGEVLNYSYNAMGSLLSLSGTNAYVSQIHYTASGQVNDQLLGNNLVQQSCYDTNTLRLTGLRVYQGTLQPCGTSPSSPHLNLSYSYQPNGNISQLGDATRSETNIYTYDEVDRLKTVSGPAVESFSYNAIGNTTNTLSDKPGSNLTAADAGGLATSCAMTTSGGMKCWGSNGNGMLGTGGGPNSLTPVSVSGLDTGVSAIGVGGWHACALLGTGGVKCWGYNVYGQVGDGTTPLPRYSPVNVSGLTSGVVAISVGKYHTCALLSTGGVKCWGNNSYGQLCNGSTTNSSLPVDVTGLTSGVIAISAGYAHTCALLTGGGVKCWGSNTYGALGDGTTTQQTTPVTVSGLSSASAISAGGYHTCALTTAGGMKCWGFNYYGQVGDGTFSFTRLLPMDVSGLTSGVISISTGDFHTCAIITGGAAKCWGSNSYGELGDGTTSPKNTPTNVSGLASGLNTIRAGIDHTCASLTAGGVKCWGRNDEGDLGNGTTGNSSTPVTVLTPSSQSYSDPIHAHAVTSLSTGEAYTYDVTGNMITRVEGGVTYTQVFDAENRLISVTANSLMTQFIYDGNGTLVNKINPDGSRTIYIGETYEVDKNSGGSVTRTVTYYPAGGAMRINSTLYYILKDHLGSASVVTDASGNTVGEQRYYSYGETRVTTGTIYTDKLFTGQREISELGIYEYGARFYSPTVGRFLSADTIVSNPFNSQDLNRFSYVRNNPLRYTDPTGHYCVGDLEGCRDEVGGNPVNGTPLYLHSPTGDGGGSQVGSTTPTPTPTSTPTPLSAETLAGYSNWEAQILQKLYSQGGPDAVHGIDYMIANGIHIKVGTWWNWQHWFNIAGWYSGDSVILDPSKNSLNEMPDNWDLSVIIHEAYHIEQGEHLAKSQLGEMQAGQIGMEVYAQLTGIDPNQFGQAYTATTPEKYREAYEGQSYWINLGILPPYPVSVEQDISPMPLYP